MSPAGTRCVAYVRRSTDKQSLSPQAQRDAIERACSERGWTLVTALEETESGRKAARPVLEAAVALCEAGGADALVVAKLDRLARSALDFLQLVARAQAGGWSLVVLDPPIDLSTAAGRMCAGILATVAEFEGELIRQRTREGLAVKRAKGEAVNQGQTSEDVAARIVRERAEGKSLPAIAKGLNADGVPTAQGGRAWYPSTVAAVLRRAAST